MELKLKRVTIAVLRFFRRLRRRHTRHDSPPEVRSLLRYTTTSSPHVRAMTLRELQEWERESHRKSPERWLDRRRPM